MSQKIGPILDIWLIRIINLGKNTSDDDFEEAIHSYCNHTTIEDISTNGSQVEKNIHTHLSYISQELLDLLMSFTEIHNEIDNSIIQTQTTSSSHKQLLLSINQLRVIYTFLEILWCWGIQRYVEFYLGDSFETDITYPRTILLPRSIFLRSQKLINPYPSPENILQYTKALLVICRNPIFRNMMSDRNFGRAIAALLVLSSKNPTPFFDKPEAPRVIQQSPPEACVLEARRLCREHCLLSDSNNSRGHINNNDVQSKAEVIQELQSLLQRCLRHGRLRWMAQTYTKLLTHLISSTNGLEAVIWSQLQCMSPASEPDTTALLRIAKLITAIPRRYSSSTSPSHDTAASTAYLCSLAPQLLTLLVRCIQPDQNSVSSGLSGRKEGEEVGQGNNNRNDQNNSDTITSHILILCVHQFCASSEALAQTVETQILRPLLRPLLYIQENSLSLGPSTSAALQSTPVMSLATQIHLVVKLLSAAPKNASLVRSVYNIGVFRAVLLVAIDRELLEPTLPATDSSEVFAITSILPFIEEDMFTADAFACLLFDRELTVGLNENGEIIPSAESGQYSRQLPLPLETVSLEDFKLDSLKQMVLSDPRLALIRHRTSALCRIIRKIIEKSSSFPVIPGSSEPVPSVDKDHEREGIGGSGPDVTGRLASRLYLCMLRRSLGLPVTPNHTPNTDTDTSITPQISQQSMISTMEAESESQRAGASVAVLEMQAGLNVGILLSDGLSVIELLLTKLQYYAEFFSGNQSDSYQSVGEVDEGVEEGQLEALRDLETCLELLGGLLGFGAARRSEAEELGFRSLLQPLQTLARALSSHSISLIAQSGEGSQADSKKPLAQTVTDLATVVLLRGCSQRPSGASPQDLQPTRDHEHQDIPGLLRQLQEDLCHPLPPMRAYGIGQILKQIQNPQFTMGAMDVVAVYHQLRAMLADTEAYVYMAAIHVIAELLHRHRKVILADVLLDLGGTDTDSPPSGPRQGKGGLGTRQRSLLCEAISTWLRRAGEGGAGPSYAPAVLRACLKVVKNRVVTLSSNSNSNVGVKLTTYLPAARPLITELSDSPATLDATEEFENPSQNDDVSVSIDLNRFRISLGGSVNSSHALDVERIAQNADSLLLRQSVMSLMADALITANWSIGPLLGDVVDVATGVLTFETRARSENRIALRSAAFVLRQIVTKIGDKLLALEDGQIQLKIILRTLRAVVSVGSQSRTKSTTTSRIYDPVVVHHAVSALAAIDQLVWDSFSIER